MTRGWRTILGLVVSLALLYWVLHDVSLTEVWGHIRAADLWLLSLAVVIQTAAFLIRAARWKVFLRPALAEPSFDARFASTCIGFMANNLLPARVGEFARAYALSRSQPITASAAFGSLVVERLFDALTLALFLAAPLFMPGFRVAPGLGDEVASKLFLVLVIFGGAAVALLLLIFRPDLVDRIFRSTIGRLMPRRAAESIAEMFRSFIEGLGAMRSPRLVVAGLVWSLAHWLWGALALWIGMLAFNITEPGFLGAVFLQGVMAFIVSVPSSPGFFGLFEASARIALSPFGVPAGLALSYALAFHITTFTPVTILGLFYLGRLGLSWGEVGHSEEIVEEGA
ncbi:MAG: flippase-like domain-containing protein [Gemmatimonadetes bacterium]|nr:flippase-like domain-containing protein [Gemmatimonadota bacterium]NIO30802.1 flippase-like domain-containing protein [Gemmatimonadota bacterium]